MEKASLHPLLALIPLVQKNTHITYLFFNYCHITFLIFNGGANEYDY